MKNKVETLKGLKEYLLSRARGQSMSEEFKACFDYVLWEIDKYRERFEKKDEI